MLIHTEVVPELPTVGSGLMMKPYSCYLGDSDAISIWIK